MQMLNKSSPEGRLKLSELSKHVAAAVGDIVQAAEQIKGLCSYHSVQLTIQQINDVSVAVMGSRVAVDAYS